MATAAVTNTFVNAQDADADEVNTNFSDLVTFINGSAVHVDGSKAFTAVVSGVTPTSAAHLATKGYVDGAGAVAGMSLGAAQTLTTATDTKIELDTNGYTDATYFTNDPTTDNDITIVKDGTYLILGGVYFAANTSGARTAAIRVDGSAVAVSSAPPLSAGGVRVQVHKIATLSAAQVVTLYGNQSSGGNLDVSSGDANTFLQVVRLTPGV